MSWARNRSPVSHRRSHRRSRRFATGRKGSSYATSRTRARCGSHCSTTPHPKSRRGSLRSSRRLPGVLVKRSGPIIAAVLSPPDENEAERLLSRVRYTAEITVAHKTNNPTGQSRDLDPRHHQVLCPAGSTDDRRRRHRCRLPHPGSPTLAQLDSGAVGVSGHGAAGFGPWSGERRGITLASFEHSRPRLDH